MNYQEMSDRLDKLNEVFESMSGDVELPVILNNITLKTALKDQVTLQMSWDSFHASVKNLLEYAELHEEETYASAITAALKDKYRSFTISEAKEIAKSDPDYRTARRLKIQVNYLFEDSKGTKGAIETRRYVLNNLTNSLIAGTDSHIL